MDEEDDDVDLSVIVVVREIIRGVEGDDGVILVISGRSCKCGLNMYK